MHFISKETVEALWRSFDVPINDKDEIDDDFCGWEHGTDRFEIWEWFDEQYARYGGVHALMHPDEHKRERGSVDLVEARKNAYRKHGAACIPSAHLYD